MTPVIGVFERRVRRAEAMRSKLAVGVGKGKTRAVVGMSWRKDGERYLMLVFGTRLRQGDVVDAFSCKSAQATPKYLKLVGPDIRSYSQVATAELLVNIQ